MVMSCNNSNDDDDDDDDYNKLHKNASLEIFCFLMIDPSLVLKLKFNLFTLDPVGIVLM